jgi:NADH:ubiquinone oxidoreductase subunit F (NADH-binding)
MRSPYVAKKTSANRPLAGVPCYATATLAAAGKISCPTATNNVDSICSMPAALEQLETQQKTLRQ